LKTLHLLRHAKSNQGSAARDHDRPLAKRGVEAAKAMAEHLKAEKFKVDYVFSSTSQRTRETYDLIKPALGSAPVQFKDELYLMDADGLLHFVHHLPRDARRVLMIGHDPGYHILANSLVDSSCGSDELEALAEKFPTGALCSLGFAGTAWTDVTPGAGDLLAFVRPKDVAQDD
jgi:phosphohistidine phosphatase